MEKYRLILISTFINTSHIYKLINSLLYAKFHVRLILINQTETNITFINDNEYLLIDEILIGKQVSLSISMAKNIGLEYIWSKNILGDYIMFPDDDASFDSDFFNNFDKTISQYNNSNLVIKVYNENTTNLYVKNKIEGSNLTIKDYQYAISINMILKYEIVKKVGLFDEYLGVGARYGAGEDNDFFIRIKKISNVIFTNMLHIYHPASSSKYISIPTREIIKRFKNYGNGVLFMLLKHNLHSQAFLLCLRAIGGCIVYLLRFNWKLSYVYFISFFNRLKSLISLSLSKEYKIVRK